MPISRSAYRILTLVLLAVLFVAVNTFSNTVFRSARIDLTQNRLYTLSEGSREVLAKLDEPITLRFFYSEKLATDFPRIRTYANQVRDLLEEIRDESNGKIVLRVIDPEPFSQQEDLAMSMGLKGAPTTEGDVIYFGLVGTNLVDGLQSIPFFTDERQDYLEYDIMKMVQTLSRPKKPVLGVVTNLPLDTGTGGLMAAMKGQSKPFMIYTELVNRFDMKFLEQKFNRVPDDVDVLMIAHPRDLDEQTLYAIDQFVMRGGRVLAFVDPFSEVSMERGEDGQPVRGFTQTSDLHQLFQSWGVDYDPTKIVGDRGLAQRVRTGFDARKQDSDYVIWLKVPKSHMNQSDIVTADVDRINLGTVGALSPEKGATTSFTPLITSSKDSRLYDRDYVASGPRPDDLLANFKPDDKQYVIAARLSGPVKSAFKAEPPMRPADDQKSSATKAKMPDYKAESDKPVNIIVVADSDIFADRFWVQTQSYLGDRVAQPIADNAAFIMSAIDNLMGSNELISLRARERADRRFEVVEQLKTQAEEHYLARQKALQATIDQTEARLADLQTGDDVAPADKEKADAEIRKFRKELLDARHEMRGVQRDLRENVETLGSRVRFINVLAMPILVAFIAIGLAVLRYRRRKARVAGRPQRKGA